MAATMAYASLLPSIKCSGCGAEVQLSLMGDHVCSGSEESTSLDSHFGRTDHDRLASPNVTVPQPEYIETVAESDEDSSTEDHQDLKRQDRPTPTIVESPPPPDDSFTALLPSPTLDPPIDTRRAAPPPVSANVPPRAFPRNDSRADGSSLPGRHAHNPSEDMLRSQESPFPLFPTKKKLGDATMSAKAKPSMQIQVLHTDVKPESVRSPGFAGMMQRMQSIKPGPFRARTKSKGRRGEKSVDFGDEPRSASISQPLIVSAPQPIPPSPPKSPMPPDQSARMVPSRPPPPRPSRPERVSSFIEELKNTPDSVLNPLIYQGPPKAASDRYSMNKPPLPPLSEERAEDATALDQEQNSSTMSSPTAESEAASEKEETRHTPSDSVSSTYDDKDMFDDRTASLASSPPTSYASSLMHRNGTSDRSSEFSNTSRSQSIQSVGHFSRSSNQENVHGNSNQQTAQAQDGGHSRSRSTSSSFSRPRAAEPAEQATLPEIPEVPEGMPADSPQAEMSSLAVAVDTAALSPISPADASPSTQENPSPELPAFPTRQPERSSPRKPAQSTYKGDCRGCGLAIRGKSIKAADGRLTGRYHKDCFVCQTCREPFPTADFYIYSDRPYCSQHYHILNGSLCEKCGQGIEGHYQRTDRGLKFHTGCFTCADCCEPLREHYYEVAAKFYCRQDAHKEHRWDANMRMARKAPEKRTTMLMVM